MTVFYFIYFALFGVLGTLLSVGGIDFIDRPVLFLGILVLCGPSRQLVKKFKLEWPRYFLYNIV